MILQYTDYTTDVPTYLLLNPLFLHLGEQRKVDVMYEGRWNRAKYFLAAVVLSIVSTLIAYAAGSAGGESAGAAISFIVSLASVVVASIFIVKRFHDLDRPGVHYWLLLIPLYNIYIALILLFQKGTDGPNQYGEDPLKQGGDSLNQGE